MEKHDKLIKKLRDLHRDPRPASAEWLFENQVALYDAAAAIETLLKENKELIEDHPEMVEADGHWEWRKPNGEVLMPKQGEWIIHGEPPMLVIECSVCGQKYFNHVMQEKAKYCSMCGAKMEETEDEVHSDI